MTNGEVFQQIIKLFPLPASHKRVAWMHLQEIFKVTEQLEWGHFFLNLRDFSFFLVHQEEIFQSKHILNKTSVPNPPHSFLQEVEQNHQLHRKCTVFPSKLLYDNVHHPLLDKEGGRHILLRSWELDYSDQIDNYCFSEFHASS